MHFNFGEWIVEALKFIETSRHVKRMAYGLVMVAIVHAIAALIVAIR